jgi:hypothetical protein
MTAQHRIAAHTSWAKTPDRAARMAPARTGFLARFERQARELLGPGATEREIARSAESLEKAFYERLSDAGNKARKARRGTA